MRKTHPEEIEQLYEFTRRHYVEYYDVQTELVDHLASAMDANWEMEPGLSFEENLQQEFRKFGVFGFSQVVDKKRRALEKRYFRLIWKELKLQLGNPRSLIFVTGMFSAIMALLKLDMELLNLSLVSLYFCLLIYLMIKTSRELKRKKKSRQKIYLLEYLILNTGTYFSVSYLPFQLLYYSGFHYTSFWAQVLISLVFTFLAFVNYICFYVLPKRRGQILKEQYPELNF